LADLTITAASVAAGTGASVDRSRNAGASLTAGQAVYLDTSSNTYKLSDADSATAAARTVTGVALNAASSGQPVAVLTGGLLTVGATVAVGTMYTGSATAGGICPVADLTTGAYPTAIGWAVSTTQINVVINASGVVKP